MATKKDLVEAYSFSRRRLVTAFVSGAPGGREVEPSRPGRTIVGGIALAVLMIAAAAVLGILTDRDQGDWDKVGLVSEKETSADYVILTEGGDLRPISNITSAMLLLGAEIEPTEVSRDVIAAEGRRGEPIGILQAPETPPVSGDLVATGWTACTSGDDDVELGVKVTVQDSPTVDAMPGAGLVVRADDRLFLVAESLPEDGRGEPRGYVHEILQEQADGILRSVVPTSQDDAVTVPREWLDLFTPGAPLTLESLGLQAGRLGEQPRDPIAGAPRARVGDLLTFDGRYFLVTDDSTATELDPFALGVYQGLRKPRPFEAEEIPTSSIPGAVQDTGNLEVNWPTGLLSEPKPGDYCAQLDAVAGGDPGARIVTAEGGEESAADVGPGSVERFVESGHGAVVRVGDWDDEGDDPTFLVDDRGFAYPLVGDAVTQLGYSGVDEIHVPDPWTGLFEPGVELSKDAASCPPTTSPRTSPCAS